MLSIKLKPLALIHIREFSELFFTKNLREQTSSWSPLLSQRTLSSLNSSRNWNRILLRCSSQLPRSMITRLFLSLLSTQLDSQEDIHMMTQSSSLETLPLSTQRSWMDLSLESLLKHSSRSTLMYLKRCLIRSQLGLSLTRTLHFSTFVVELELLGLLFPKRLRKSSALNSFSLQSTIVS